MSTTLKKAIRERREEIFSLWREKVFDRLSDKISPGTPIGDAFVEGMAMILDGFASDDRSLRREGVTRVARILAVHSLRPSRSLSMFVELKTVLVETVPAGEDGAECVRRIDETTLEAFDSFMEHRETIYRLKVEESQKRMHMQLRGKRS